MLVVVLPRDGARVELDDAEQQSLAVDDARVDPVPDRAERELADVFEAGYTATLRDRRISRRALR